MITVICDMGGFGLGGRGLILNPRSFPVVYRYLPIECTLGALIRVRGCFIVARARAMRVTTKARQSHEFQRHHPEKFHGGTDSGAAKIHDVLATPDHMRSSMSSASLFGEADVWLRTMVASMGTLKDWAEFNNDYALDGSVSTLDGVGWGAVDTDADYAYYFVHDLLDSIGFGVVTTARTHYKRPMRRL
ncbi:hypothetical protein Syun_003676 [Stephania yunnanensis]|uniref:Uncharacterized protein n=1 Tax=Stephania yunnanensis TaxID=152371 RepID=A0AAP0Q1U3_9MAGN